MLTYTTLGQAGNILGSHESNQSAEGDSDRLHLDSL